MSDKEWDSNLVSISPGKGRLEDAHSFLDEMISKGATGVTILTVHEFDEGEQRSYSSARFGAIWPADEVFVAQRHSMKVINEHNGDDE